MSLPLSLSILGQFNVQPGTPWSQYDVSCGQMQRPPSPRHPVTSWLSTHAVLSPRRDGEGCSGVTSRGGHPGLHLDLHPTSSLSPFNTLLGERIHLTAAKKQIILPAMAVFTQKPLVYEEQLSQSTQRNTAIFFEGFFFSLLSETKGYLRKKENEAALQNNCCLFLSCCISSSILSQTPFAPGSQPRCPPHPMPRVPPAAVAPSVRQTRREAPGKTHS